jgi:hypothetical protein
MLSSAAHSTLRTRLRYSGVGGLPMWIFLSVVLILAVISPGFRQVLGWIGAVIGVFTVIAIIHNLAG